MKSTDFNKPITSKKLNESLSKSYGSKLNLERYTYEQLEDFRNKIRTDLFQAQSTSGFNETLANETYQRNKLVLDVINTHLSERFEDQAVQVSEGIDSKQAGVVQAAIDMQNKIKNMLEDMGAMMTKTMVALADDIKETIGADAAEQFGALVTPALEAAMQHLQGTRTAVESGVGILTGEGAPAVIGQEPVEPEMDAMNPEAAPEFGNDIDAEAPIDDFGASDAEAGGPEVAGRAKRESVMFRKPSITEGNNLMFKLAR
jgi:hypothetical protein